MTQQEEQNYRLMKEVLTRITSYDSTDELRENSHDSWGLDYEEALEMAYDNILHEANFGLKNLKEVKIK